MHPADPPEPRFAPFIRSDQYGHLGLAPQTPLHYLQLGLLAVTLVPLKIVGVMTCLTTFYLICRLSALLPRYRQAELVPYCGKLACRACLFCIGFVHIKWAQADEAAAYNDTNHREATDLGAAAGSAPESPAVAIVSNHCGWTDILVHMARSFPSFVARADTIQLTMIGLISQHMGCVYVDRATASSHKGVAHIVKERIAKAAAGQSSGQRPMLLFPEGTTTNGDYMLDFRKGAFLAGAPVQPVILDYGHGRMSPSWETISAPRHIFLMLVTPVHQLTFTELPVYRPSKEERADPGLYAANVRKYMLKASGLKASSATLADKLVLHRQIRDDEIALRKKQA